MSLGNLLVRNDLAYLVTDSGYFNVDGEILVLAPKVMEFVDQRIAVACVGSGITLPHLSRYLPPLDGATQMDVLKAILTGVRRAYAAESRCPERDMTRWLVALYSEKDGRAHGLAFFTNPNDGAHSQQAFTYYRTAAVVMPESPDDAIGAVFDPVSDFMPIVARQREVIDWPVGAKGRRVAGEIVLTTVSAGGVEHRVLHDYGTEGCPVSERYKDRLAAA